MRRHTSFLFSQVLFSPPAPLPKWAFLPLAPLNSPASTRKPPESQRHLCYPNFFHCRKGPKFSVQPCQQLALLDSDRRHVQCLDPDPGRQRKPYLGLDLQLRHFRLGRGFLPGSRQWPPLQVCGPQHERPEIFHHLCDLPPSSAQRITRRLSSCAPLQAFCFQRVVMA